ncbi:MAG: Gfo/Idh/MocA family oxidoreductase [bacterium]|nr:Gfo/Idh/MocA family oxidoreductase [bacterium]
MGDPGRRLRIGVVGTGALGRHHVRILSELETAELVGAFDIERSKAEAVCGEFGAEVFGDLDSLAAAADAVVVAAPTRDHAEIGCRLLEGGLHVMVEKPITRTLEEADALIAAAGDRVLAVGHVEFYNPAVQALLGIGLPPGFAEVHRMGEFSSRSLDIDVVRDLMIHDLQILQRLDPSPLKSLAAVGVNVLTDRDDIANARLEFESGLVANLTASRVSDHKIRKLRVIVPGIYLSLDYQKQEIKGYRLRKGGGVRDLERMDVAIEREEPLKCELRAFVSACRGEEVPLVTGEDGRRALAAAQDVCDQIEQQRSAVQAFA